MIELNFMEEKKIKFEIFKKNEIYYFENKNLKIFHQDENLQRGYKFCNEKALENIKYIKNDEYNNFSQNHENSKISKSLKTMIIENSLRSLFIIVTFCIILTVTVLFVTSTVKKNEVKGGKGFWKKIEREIVRSSEKEIDPETQQKIITGIKKIVSNYKPFYDEIIKISD